MGFFGISSGWRGGAIIALENQVGVRRWVLGVRRSEVLRIYGKSGSAVGVAPAQLSFWENDWELKLFNLFLIQSVNLRAG